MRLADGVTAPGRPREPVSPVAEDRGGASGFAIGGAHKPGVKEVATEFEALLLQQLVAAMREGTSSEGEDGPGKQLVDHFIEQGLAGHIAHAGGVGLGRYLERETGGEVVDASRSMGAIGAAGSFGNLMRPGGVDALERLVRFGPASAPVESEPAPDATQGGAAAAPFVAPEE